MCGIENKSICHIESECKILAQTDYKTRHDNVCWYIHWILCEKQAPRKKCPYSELFWSVFSSIRTECGEIWSISPYSVQMRENTDENNSEYGHFSRSNDFEGKALCYEHEPDGVIVNEMYKILWDSTIQCDIKIENRRPNIDIIDKTKREVKSMDINIPRDVRMNGREKGKTKKYKMLKG